MKLLQYICVQPYLVYYSWQVDVMLNNFTEVGINQSDIHILLSYDSEVDVKTHYVWNKVIEKYKDVNFYFYPDLRKHKNYPSSIRPNVLAQFYKDYPEFSENVVFYHDCDILFTKTPDFSKFINDNNWYLSDTVSYISSDYVKSKEYGVYEKMCDIVGIDKSIPEKNNRDSGGAQYIIKDVDHTFWERVEIDSENLFREITIINNDIKKEKPEYHELQIWCADMWALLWNAWKNGIKTQVVDEMNFSWATSHISEWDKNTIYHNAGVDSNMRYLFNKSNYQSDLPVNLDLSKVDNSYCSYKYANFIKKNYNKIKKAAIFYTDNQNPNVTNYVLNTIHKIVKNTDIKVITCSDYFIDNNPFQNFVLHNPIRSHKNIVEKILYCLNELKKIDDYKYVSFLEHDVLYPDEYFNYPKFDKAICNMNYMGICNNGFQEKLPAQLPLPQMTMELDFAIENFNNKMKIIEKQGWAYIEPDVVDKYNSKYPTLHINHGKHFTSHFECYKPADKTDIIYWGNYNDIWNNIL